MSGWLRHAWHRGRAVLTRDRLDREFDEELTTHLELLVDEYRRSGLSHADARRQAIRRLGHPALLRELHREQRGLPFMDALARDLRYAVRMMWKSPLFTAVAVLSLGLGIGANTALFSLVDGLLIRSLPVRDPDRLVQIQRVAVVMDIRKLMLRSPDAVFESVRSHGAVLDEVVGFNGLDRPEIAIEGVVQPAAQVEEISENFFRDLGVTPSVGRAPDPSERGVAVISHGFWRARFGGGTSVLGRSLTIDRQPYTIVGVAPPRFLGLSIDTPADLWIAPRTPGIKYMFARLKPGVSPSHAQAALQALFDQLVLDPPGTPPMRVELLPAGKGLSQLRTQYQRPLMALAVLVTLLLLITCANLGNLLMLRNTTRRRELSVRVALGASRSRLMMQSLVESALLAALGAIVALVLARWGVSLILSMLPVPVIPRSLVFAMDPRTLGFAAAVTASSAVLFAIPPARRAARVDLTGDLKTAHGGTPIKSHRRLGRALVGCQVALSVLLLAGAGLFVQTLRNLSRLDIGFDPDKLLQVSLDTRAAGYGKGQVGALHALLLERISAIPGVGSVTSVRNQVMRNVLSRTTFTSLGNRRLGPQESWDSVDVGPSFFETMRIPVVRGRTFVTSDVTGRRPQLVISEAFARTYFPGEDPVGQLGGAIVGVARDARLASVRRAAGPMMYFMLPQEPDRVGALEIRTAGAPEAIAPAIRQEIQRVNPRLLLEIRTMRDEIDRSTRTERMVATISGFFSILGLLLASIGIFGITAYTVTQRTNELGIRMALGASRWSIVRDSLRDTILIVAAGLAAGIVAAVTAVRVTASMVADLLFGLTATDATNMTAAILVMIAASLTACILPARRATRIDPLTAIRHE